MATDRETHFPDYVGIESFDDEPSAIREAELLRETGIDAQVVPTWPRGFSIVVRKELAAAAEHYREVVPPEGFWVARVRRGSLAAVLFGVPLSELLFTVSRDQQFAERMVGYWVFGLVQGAVYLLARRYPSRAQRSRQRRANKVAERLQADLDGGRFSVYLRSFSTTGRVLQTAPVAKGWIPFWKTGLETVDIEHVMAAAFDDLDMTQIALGDPGEQFGAGLITSSDEEWRNRVKRILDQACLVVLVPGSSEGTVWEMGEVRQRYLHKTVFLMPAASRSYEWSRHWLESSRRAAERGLYLPPYDQKGMIFSMASAREIDFSISKRRWTVFAMAGALARFLP